MSYIFDFLVVCLASPDGRFTVKNNAEFMAKTKTIYVQNYKQNLFNSGYFPQGMNYDIDLSWDAKDIKFSIQFLAMNSLF